MTETTVPRTQRSAPSFTAWCAAEPGPYQAPAFVTVPALRSGMKNAAPRPGHESDYALNQPLASPVKEKYSPAAVRAQETTSIALSSCNPPAPITCSSETTE